jgi:hypothetical protein
MKTTYLPIITTTVSAVLMVLLKKYILIDGPYEALGSLLMIYTISWCILGLVKKPLRQSYNHLLNACLLLFTFIKISWHHNTH